MALVLCKERKRDRQRKWKRAKQREKRIRVTEKQVGKRLLESQYLVKIFLCRRDKRERERERKKERERQNKKERRKEHKRER